MSRRFVVPGVLACAAALLLMLVASRAALAGWLAAFAFWSSLPIGALGLLMMMWVIPGPWRAELAPLAETALLLLPLAALAALPMLLGVPLLYDWMHEASHGYRAVYLSWPGFALRTVVFFLCLGVLAFLLNGRPVWAGALSAGGLILYVLLATTVAVDWLMSLEPAFHSSGFGLYVLSIQMNIALAWLIVARLSAGGAAARTGLLGALMLCGLLFWAYLAFMQYFIIWSDNLPHTVQWYQRRAAGGWSLLEYAIGALGLGPLVLLLFPPLRAGTRALLVLSLAVLAGKAIEFAWIVLPILHDDLAVAGASTALALAGLGALSAVLRSVSLPVAWTDPVRHRGAAS